MSARRRTVGHVRERRICVPLDVRRERALATAAVWLCDCAIGFVFAKLFVQAFVGFWAGGRHG